MGNVTDVVVPLLILILLYAGVVACHDDIISSNVTGAQLDIRHYSHEQPFLHKCGGSVEEEFWNVPEEFQIIYGREKLDYFHQQFGDAPFNFTLKTRQLVCKDVFSVSATVGSANGSAWEDDSRAHFNFTPDGFVAYIKGIEEIYFDRENYCIQSLTPVSVTVKFCKSQCYHDMSERGAGLCIPKCCPLGMVMKDMGDEPCACSESPQDWTPDIYENLPSAKRSYGSPQLHFVDPSSISCMNDSVEFRVHAMSELKILSDGRIFSRRPGTNSLLSWEPVFTGEEAFCVDGFWQGENYDPKSAKLFVTTCGVTEGILARNQELSEQLERHLLRSKIVWTFVYIPCVLIYSAILAVYIVLWDKQNSHGWTIMAFSGSQLLLYTVLLILIGTVLYDKIQLLVSGPWYPLCVILGILHHFADLSCYTWTAMLTLDVWRRLRSTTACSSGFDKGGNRFLMYCCFGVGVPVVIVSIGSVMEWPLRKFEGYRIEPGYSNYCTVYGREAYLTYMGIPNAIVFGINLILAVLTFKSAWEMKSLKNKHISSRSDRVIFTGKLVFLTGLFLVFEFVFNFAALIDINVYFTILEAYRVLYAVGLFWIFVCNKQILHQLSAKIPCLPRQREDKATGSVSDAVFFTTNV